MHPKLVILHYLHASIVREDKKIWNTYCSRSVCKSKVTIVEMPGQIQLDANNAFFNSSSQTTCSENRKVR